MQWINWKNWENDAYHLIRIKTTKKLFLDYRNLFQYADCTPFICNTTFILHGNYARIFVSRICNWEILEPICKKRS